MATAYKTGQTVKVTVSKTPTRAAALKTLERWFMKDKAIAAPIKAREANFKELPKRRGGQIWTKRPNKVFPVILKGAVANIKATPQFLKDMASVADCVKLG